MVTKEAVGAPSQAQDDEPPPLMRRRSSSVDLGEDEGAPSPMTVIGSMLEPGLGVMKWWMSYDEYGEEGEEEGYEEEQQEEEEQEEEEEGG